MKKTKVGVVMLFMIIKNEKDKLLVEMLYNQYKNLMFTQAYEILQDKFLTEDAIHQSFIRVIKYLHKFTDEICPQNRNLIVIICENVAKDMYKERLYLNKNSDSINEVVDEAINDNVNPADIVINKESIIRIKDAIKNLDRIYRDVIVLKETHECSNKEICDLLNITPEALKKRLYRARKMLAQVLAKEDELR